MYLSAFDNEQHSCQTLRKSFLLSWDIVASLDIVLLETYVWSIMSEESKPSTPNRISTSSRKADSRACPFGVTWCTNREWPLLFLIKTLDYLYRTTWRRSMSYPNDSNISCGSSCKYRQFTSSQLYIINQPHVAFWVLHPNTNTPRPQYTLNITPVWNTHLSCSICLLATKLFFYLDYLTI